MSLRFKSAVAFFFLFSFTEIQLEHVSKAFHITSVYTNKHAYSNIKIKTMNEKEKAQELVDKIRIILMNEDTDCGNEILCTLVAKECAKIAVEEIIEVVDCIFEAYEERNYYNQVLKEIELI